MMRKTFPSVDKIRKYYVFNIGGNKLRLIDSTSA
ncbi:type II toxin-antitoxin system HigB family toxin [Fastidiosibacter lacustris]